MRKHCATGRVLDFGCGSGNNTRFFAEQGYDVHGTDITDSALPLIRENLGTTDQIKILPPDIKRLPFDDGYFDAIISNQVLYYLADKNRILDAAAELCRVLRPGGVVFLTMMGPRNYYISEGYAQPIGSDVYELNITGDHRLSGYNQVLYVVRDAEHLRELFGAFRPLTVGHFEQAMFDLKSNFHWIFAGTKA